MSVAGRPDRLRPAIFSHSYRPEADTELSEKRTFISVRR